MHRPFQSYQLHIRLRRLRVITVGKLGRFVFPEGEYIYTGSAQKNIEARVRRHLSQTKRLRWHIDYLLAASHAHVVRVRLFRTSECALNQRTRGRLIVARFGASDCTNECGGHLKYIDSRKRSLK